MIIKKSFLTVLAACSLLAANAQEKSILLYGNATYSGDNIDYGSYKTTETHWGAMPGIGYQYDKNWTIGLQGSYMQGRTPNYTGFGGTVQTYISNDWSVGPFLRYAYALSNIFTVYGQFNIGYAGGNYQMKDVPPLATYSGFSASVAPYLGINVYKTLCLNFSVGGLGYMTQSWTHGESYGRGGNPNMFSLTFGQQFSVGISKNFMTGQHKMKGHAQPGDDTRKMDTKDDDDDDAPKTGDKNDKKDKKEKKKRKPIRDDEERN